MIVVVGSGPTGLSAARIILNKGLKVLLLDINNEEESQELKLAPPKDSKSKSRVFDMNRVTNIIRDNSSSRYLQQSIARGGFSKVWGAAIGTPGLTVEDYRE